MEWPIDTVSTGVPPRENELGLHRHISTPSEQFGLFDGNHHLHQPPLRLPPLLPISRNNPTLCSNVNVRDRVDSLVERILRHPKLPLLFQGVFAAVNGTPWTVYDNSCPEGLEYPGKDSILRNSGLQGPIPDEALDSTLRAVLEAVNKIVMGTACHIPVQIQEMISASRNRVPNRDFKRAQIDNTYPISCTRFKPESKLILETWFYDNFLNPYPSPPQKKELANKSGLDPSQIDNFFSNLRMRIKRKAFRTLKPDEQYLINAPSLAPLEKWKVVVEIYRKKGLGYRKTGTNRLLPIPAIFKKRISNEGNLYRRSP